MKFTKFASAVHTAYDLLAAHQLYTVDLTGDQLFHTYIHSFPAGTNEIHIERTAHDCSCCKNFIRDLGNVVAIINGEICTIWDVIADDEYQIVADALNKQVKEAPIVNTFLREVKYGAKVGNRSSLQVLEDSTTIVWNHFEATVPTKYMSDSRATVLGLKVSRAEVFERGLEEITPYAITTVLDLIASDALYKGAEFKLAVDNFNALYKEYQTVVNKNIFIWENVNASSNTIKNTVIGSLLMDLSDKLDPKTGDVLVPAKDLTTAVTSFELKVAPENYKRPKAVVTQGMVDAAVAKIQELGIEDSLYRRVAVLEDISINDQLFVDNDIAPKLKDSIAGILAPSVKKKPAGKSTGEQEISIASFLTSVLPTATVIEAYLATKLVPNLMTLVSPLHSDAPNILAWDNNSSWAYNGNLTDSAMKANVKDAGGNVEGVLRFSIQWNDTVPNGDDLDAHAKSPGEHIYYSNHGRDKINKPNKSSGTLDVDVRTPQGVAVENIIYTDINSMREGDYEFVVHNFSNRGGKDFTAEIEFDGIIHSFAYSGKLPEQVEVAVVNYSKKDGFKVVRSMGGTAAEAPAKPMWNITTSTYHKVSTMCLSPNFWGDNKSGNKHFFFLLEGCENPDIVRGLYNEYLHPSLTPHRKVFETLGAQSMCPDSKGLSGIGFSSTVRNELKVKVDGRPYLIKF